MNRRKQILRQRGGEVAKAGRMFFEALFSPDPGAFFNEKGKELERELADRRVIVASYEADLAAQWGRKARDLVEQWGWLWGVWGLLLCSPLLAVTKVISEHVDGLAPIAMILANKHGAPRARRPRRRFFR